jgi:hypothetical protein
LGGNSCQVVSHFPKRQVASQSAAMLAGFTRQSLAVLLDISPGNDKNP